MKVLPHIYGCMTCPAAQGTGMVERCGCYRFGRYRKGRPVTNDDMPRPEWCPAAKENGGPVGLGLVDDE